MAVTTPHSHDDDGDDTPPPRGYAAAFDIYWRAGWKGVLPLPPAAKTPPPHGWTGRGAPWPSYPDLYTWAGDHDGSNLALRMPEDVIGIDVDSYAGKPGAATLTDLIIGCGPLPATWRTTSRDDGVSGIRLYQVPPGLAWPSVAGPGIEIIRHTHRYALAWPSTHPDTGNTYRWVNPVGQPVIGDVPTPHELPHLPAAWVDRLTGRREDDGQPHPQASQTAARGWLSDLPDAPACPHLLAVTGRAAASLALPGAASRHDIMITAVMRVVMAAAEGHPGAPAALGTLHKAWVNAIAADRGPRIAEDEWGRALTGAARRAALVGAPPTVDPCADPFHGIVKEQPSWTPTTPSSSTSTTTSAPTRPDAPISAPTPEPPSAPADKASAPTAQTTSSSSDLIHGVDADTYRQLVAHDALRLHIAADARALHLEQRAGQGNLPPLVCLDDFLAVEDPPVAYRVDKVWPSGGRVVLAAQFKAGKSTTVGNILRSFADGDQLFDAFDATPAQRVTLVDNELDENMLRRWLRQQGIDNTGGVQLASLRGRLSTFNILEPAVRSRWAEQINGADILVFDCLRPALDALGLDENREAGRFLEAFDELITEAGIGEALIVHHMGHSGERSRGDSRILDWPDALWRLLKEENVDGTENRYFTAYGRDVDVPEMRLGYDELTRRLFKVGGSRSDRRAEAALDDVLIALGDASAPMSGRAVEQALAHTDHRREVVRAALRRGIENGVIRVFEGPRRAVMHALVDPECASAPSAPSVRRRTVNECASAPIGRTAHSLALEGSAPEENLAHSNCQRCGQRLSLARSSRGATHCAGCDPES